MMNDTTLDSPSAIKSFMAGIGKLELSVPKNERYDWIREKLMQTSYLCLSKKDKAVVRGYIQKATGYSRAQLTRLINQYRKSGKIVTKTAGRHKFARQYTIEDIQLLAKTD